MSNAFEFEFPSGLMLAVIPGLLIALPFFSIVKKSGRSAASSILFGCLMLVPVLNFVLLILFAFSAWPIEQELERTRSRINGSGD